MSRARQHVVSLVCTLLLSFTPALAQADDLADEADLQFNLGADRYEARDFQGALEHFLASNRLVPNKNVVFNIARTYEQLKKAPEAYRYYVLALEGEKDPAARKRVEEAVARITPSVAILRVETNPPGATVYLDRRDLGPRGTTPRVLGLAAGKRKIIVELPGYEPVQTEAVDLAVGQERKIELKLVRQVGTLKVEGEPGGVVRLDEENGEPLCTVPCSVEAPIGRHVVYVTKPGFATSEYNVEIPVKQTATVRTKLSAETGALVVNADVRDALIEIDGQPMGFTPAVLAVQVGEHKLKVSRSGFRAVEQSIVISKKDQTKLDLQLASQEEVTAASRVTESVEDAPASVSIISRDELRAMGYPTVAEAVRGVRGLYLSDDRSYQTVGFRGFSRPGNYGNRVLILLDGQPLNDNYIWSSYAGYDGRVDIDDVERIEIVRGPGSVLYGTSAFFGVINLVTRPRSLPSFAEGSVSTADYGVGRARATGYYRFSKDAGMWTSVSGAYGAGRDFYFPEYVADPTKPNPELGANGLPVDGNARGVDGFRAGTINGRVWYKSFTAQWFLTSRSKTLPTGEYGTVFGDSRTRFRDTRGMIEARFEPQVSEKLQLLSRAHVNLYNFAGFYAYSGPEGSDRELFQGIWAGAEQRAVFTPNSAIRLTAGGEFIRHFQAKLRDFNDTAAAVTDSNGNPSLNVPFNNFAGYLNADVSASKSFKVSAGARFDYFSNLDTFEFLPAFNPRVAAIFKPYTGGNLKVLLGKAFKTPAVYELYYVSSTQAKSQGLKPEEVYSGEVEFTHRFTPTLTATAAAYMNYVTKVIELGKTTVAAGEEPKDIYRNSDGNVLIMGGEAEIRREWRQGWMASASYSFSRARYVSAPDLRRVPNSPEHLASFKGAVPIIGRSLMAMTRVSIEGPRPDNLVNKLDSAGQPNTEQGFTDAGVIWDLVFSGEAEKLGVRYAIGVYNVADQRYDSVPSAEFRQRTIVQSGRSVLASLTATF
ncbi:MAG: TonB-dependent receptor [Polyangiaceae bacterium]|nr:TonB-dependent receptor [Polyangiaceae bacterium]